MDKKKLRDVYNGIKEEIEKMPKGGSVDFGVGSYQDGLESIVVEREMFNLESTNQKIFYVNNKYPMVEVKKIVAIVYRAIIDNVTEYGFNPEFLKD